MRHFIGFDCQNKQFVTDSCQFVSSMTSSTLHHTGTFYASRQTQKAATTSVHIDLRSPGAVFVKPTLHAAFQLRNKKIGGTTSKGHTSDSCNSKNRMSY